MFISLCCLTSFMSFHLFKILSSSITSRRFHHIDSAEFCFLNEVFYIFIAAILTFLLYFLTHYWCIGNIYIYNIHMYIIIYTYTHISSHLTKLISLKFFLDNVSSENIYFNQYFYILFIFLFLLHYLGLPEHCLTFCPCYKRHPCV